MKAKRILWPLSIVLAVLLLGAPQDWAQPKPERRGPVITHAFAVERGEYGYIWKIYLEADDPEGQMLKIASVVDQAGTGRYPTDWIYLKPQHQKHFKGFIQWNTYSTKAGYMIEGTPITLRVSVFDKSENESNEVIFPFTFEMTPGQYQYKPPPPFDQGDLVKLGNVMIDLYPSDMPGADGGSGSPN